MDFIDIFRTFHPNTEEYTFSSSVHGTFSRIDHNWVTNQTSVNLRKSLTDIKGEIDSNTIRVVDFNTHSHQ